MSDTTAGAALGIPIQDEAHWHELRAQFGGSSEAAALFGLGYESMPSRWSLYMIKSGQMDEPTFEADDRVWFGKELEWVVAKGITRKHGLDLQKVRRYYRHPNADILMGCTCDFEVTEHEDGPGIIEIKNRDYLEWSAAYTEDECSIRDKIQMAHQLACRPDMKWCALGCLVGGNRLFFYRYTREDLAEIITDVERGWLELYEAIAAKKEPDITADELPQWAVRHFDKLAVEPAVSLWTDDKGGEFAEACKTYHHSTMQAKYHKELADDAKAKLVNTLGEATIGNSPNWDVKIKYSQTDPSIVTLPDEMKETLRAMAAKLKIAEDDDKLQAIINWQKITRRGGVRTKLEVEYNPKGMGSDADPEAAAAEKEADDGGASPLM